MTLFMRSVLTVALLSFLFSQCCKAQRSYRDSLSGLLTSSVNDSIKCNKITAYLEKVNNDDSTMNYLVDAKMKLCEEHLKSDKKNKELFLFYTKQFAGIKNAKGYNAIMKGDVKAGLAYFTEAMELRRKVGFYSGLVSSYNNIGGVYKYMGDMHKALQYFDASCALLKVLKDTVGLAIAYGHKGSVLSEMGNVKEALECIHRSLKLNEALGNKKALALDLLRMGNLYETQMESAKGLEYMERSYKISMELGDKYGVGNTLSDMGLVWMNMCQSKDIDQKKCFAENYSRALVNFKKSLEIRRSINDKMGIYQAMSNIGGVYIELGDPECMGTIEVCRDAGRRKAISIFRESLEIARSIGDKKGEAVTLQNLAASLFKTGESSESFSFALQSLRLSREMGFPNEIKHACGVLKEIYKKKGMWKEAYEAQAEFKKMSDSIQNVSNKSAAIQKTIQYEYEKREVEARASAKADRERLDAVAAEERSKRRITIFSIGLGAVVAALFIVIVFKRFRISQKQKKIIEKKEKETHEQNLIIAEQKKVIDEHQEEILDSIRYARRIQFARLPNEKYIQKQMEKLIKTL